VSGIGRRFFLKIDSATGVAAACSPSHAPDKLVPLLNPPENLVPGKPLFYRTVCRGCSAGCGVTARSREGRVVKLEGNPDDPIGAGALCARGQAELQALYSPDRLRGPLARKGSELLPTTWPDALAQIGTAMGKLRGADGRVPGLRMLSRCEPGSAGAVQKTFVSALTSAAKARIVFEPRDPGDLRAANARLFGAAELPVLDLSRARAVVSFGADFLETWLSPVEQARMFMAARSGPDRPRLTWVGSRLPMSGANADDWLRVRPGDELLVACELLRWLVDPANGVAQLAPEAAAIRKALPPPRMAQGISPEQIARLGRELSVRRPSALLGPGALSSGGGGLALAATVQLTNFVLGNLGKTVLLGLGSEADVPSAEEDVLALVEQARRGEVTALFVHRADPLGKLPASARVEEALRKVPLIVAFGERLDATARFAHFVLPDHHALESFGDLEPRKGILALAQPAWDRSGTPARPRRCCSIWRRRSHYRASRIAISTSCRRRAGKRLRRRSGRSSRRRRRSAMCRREVSSWARRTLRRVPCGWSPCHCSWARRRLRAKGCSSLPSQRRWRTPTLMRRAGFAKCPTRSRACRGQAGRSSRPPRRSGWA